VDGSVVYKVDAVAKKEKPKPPPFAWPVTKPMPELNVATRSAIKSQKSGDMSWMQGNVKSLNMDKVIKASFSRIPVVDLTG